MRLSEEERKAVVDYRIEKAEHSYEEAEKVCSMQLWNIAANRLYYALYYMSSALLIHNEKSAHTHSGLLTMIHLHYVKTGLLSYDDGKLLKTLFRMRQEGDYEDFVEISKDDVEHVMPQTRNLLDKIRGLIKTD